MIRVIVDTGPLVALLNKRDRHHQWTREVFSSVVPPLWTCEAVVSEACFLLGHLPGGSDALRSLLSNKAIVVDFRLSEEADAVCALMHKYASVPMALADACLVRMAELEMNSVIVTFDSDFRVYRRKRRQVVPTIMPTNKT